MRATINNADCLSDGNRNNEDSESIVDSTTSSSTATTMATASTNGISSEKVTATYIQESRGIVVLDDGDSRLLVVSQLSKIVVESELHSLFSQSGGVEQTHIKRSNLSKQSLGYGHVLMCSMVGARRAMARFNGSELHGRKIQIDWARDNTTLHIGNVSAGVDKVALADVFRV
jgi:RNA recognition motif-containing protein